MPRPPAPERPARTKPTSISIFGAPGDTRNFGLSALLDATLAGLAARDEDLVVTVFDNGLGRRTRTIDGFTSPVTCRGARLSRRLYRAESLWSIRAANRLGGFGNANAQTIRASAAVLDLTGGDSFTDMYGMKRFQGARLPKVIALEAGRPLVLLPQTYGPFADRAVRTEAVRIINASAAAWARDRDTFEGLRELLGASFDPRRHREGIDLAFALSPAPTDVVPIRKEPDRSVVGINVSGLLYYEQEAAERFGLRFSLDYRAAMHELTRRLLLEGAQVYLVPHVVPLTGPDSDVAASHDLRDAMPESDRADIEIVRLPGPREAKAFIAQMDWFCGARMHATIASLSSAVPTAGIAYSVKMPGVFATCGQRAAVVDARSSSTVDAADELVESFTRRVSTRAALEAALPAVFARAEQQMDDIVATFHPERAADR